MVSFTTEPGLPAVPRADIGFNPFAPAYSAALALTASAHKCAFVGQIWHPTVKSGNINIRKVHFRCGTIASLNAASEFRVSLQNISLTAGPPYQPDGTQDQFYDFKTATTALVQNAENVTGNLSADRVVDTTANSLDSTNSRWFCVVFEYQAWNTSDSVIVSQIGDTGGAWRGLGGAVLNTASWVVQSNSPVVYFECDDGSFAFFAGASVFTGATSTVSFSSSAAVRRVGVKFKFPTTRQICRLGLSVAVVNGVDGRLVLYDSDGTTELVAVNVDNDAVNAAQGLILEIDFSPVTLQADTFYRFAFVPTTATTNSATYFDLNFAGQLGGCLLGANAMWTQHDGTSWADTALRRPGFTIGTYAYATPGGSSVIGG